MIVPSRGRPSSVQAMAAAWHATGTVLNAALIWVIDRDDPEYDGYVDELIAHPWMRFAVLPVWKPMVPKLNEAATLFADEYDIVGFMGDDHQPRTYRWDLHIETAVGINTRIVYGRDGFQDAKLPTWWAMSSNIVKSLDRMVPADVAHLYCDNAVKALGEESGTLVYRDDIFIEHMHPVAGKAAMDAGYLRVNRAQQYERDANQYSRWVKGGGLASDVARVRELVH